MQESQHVPEGSDDKKRPSLLKALFKSWGFRIGLGLVVFGPAQLFAVGFFLKLQGDEDPNPIGCGCLGAATFYSGIILIIIAIINAIFDPIHEREGINKPIQVSLRFLTGLVGLVAFLLDASALLMFLLVDVRK